MLSEWIFMVFENLAWRIGIGSYFPRKLRLGTLFLQKRCASDFPSSDTTESTSPFSAPQAERGRSTTPVWPLVHRTTFPKSPPPDVGLPSASHPSKSEVESEASLPLTRKDLPPPRAERLFVCFVPPGSLRPFRQNEAGLDFPS